jgi:hypothetical protein
MATETLHGIEAQIAGLVPIASSRNKDLYRTEHGFYFCVRGGKSGGLSLTDTASAREFIRTNAPQKLKDFDNIKPQLQQSSYSGSMLYR